MTNLSSPLGKHFQASQVSKLFAEGKTVWSDIRGGFAGPLPWHSQRLVTVTPTWPRQDPGSVRQGLAVPCSPRLPPASFLCLRKNPHGSAASPARARLAPLPGGYSAAARWPLCWLLQPTRKEGTGDGWPWLFHFLNGENQGH